VNRDFGRGLSSVNDGQRRDNHEQIKPVNNTRRNDKYTKKRKMPDPAVVNERRLLVRTMMRMQPEEITEAHEEQVLVIRY